jgi:tetratricopeptide (TPR) repeat protein
MASERIRWGLGWLLMVGWLGLGWVETARADEEPDIPKLIADLGSKRFAVRERASQSLWKLGEQAEPALRAALNSTDSEVVTRAKAILDRFDAGLYPDTSEAIVKLVELYRTGNQATTISAAKSLVEQGKPGHRVLRRLLQTAQDIPTRDLVLTELTRLGATLWGKSIEAGELTLVQELLETLTLNPQNKQALLNFATWHALQGTLQPVIARYQTNLDRLAKANDRSGVAHASAVLIHLHRAAGELAAARKLAEELDDARLVDAVAWEQRDWAALAKLHTDLGQDSFKHIATLASYHRLARNDQAFQRLIGELKDLANQAHQAGDGVQVAVEMLLINGQTTDALKLLQSTGKHRHLLCELLAHRQAYREALALAEAEVSEPSEQRQLLFRLAKTRAVLGLSERARKDFADLAETLTPLTDIAFFSDCLKHQVRLGFKDSAQAHALKGIAQLQRANADPSLLGPIFEPFVGKERAGQAVAYWQWLRASQGGVPLAERFKRVLASFEASKPTADDLAMAERLCVGDFKLVPNPHAVEALYLAANIYERAEKIAAATDAYRQAATQPGQEFAATMKLADLYAKQKDYERAAKEYEQAWNRDSSKAIALYLRGQMRQKAGQVESGRRDCERARLVPLGDAQARMDLADALRQRGYTEDARRERETILNYGWYQQWYIGNVINVHRYDLEARGQWFEAADLIERGLVGSLRTGASFVEPVAYLNVPAAVYALRARGHAQAGQVEQALAQTRTALAITPGNIDLVIKVVPGLEKRNARREADNLYAESADRLAKLIDEYPHSAMLRNSFAWLSAGCKRRLDAALTHAKRAVELRPDDASVRDTLAEVHFRRGEFAQAIAQMEECLRLAPERAYFRKQLERFRAGDRDSDPPDED